MRTRAVLGSIFGSLAVLVIGWQAGASAAAAHLAATTAGASDTPGSSSGTSASGTGSSATSSGSGGKTYTGTSVETRFGAVQVSVTVASGTITNVTAVHLTDADGRSEQISNYAAPILRKEVLAAQSANVQSVSGATYTSQGYLTSLQSALDRAGIKK